MTGGIGYMFAAFCYALALAIRNYEAGSTGMMWLMILSAAVTAIHFIVMVIADVR